MSLATAKQLRFLAVLVEDRVGFVPEVGASLTEDEASALIDHALTLPKTTRTAATPGLYLYNGAVYRVRVSRTSGHAYAEVMAAEGGSGRWKIAPGVVYRVRHRLTLAEAIGLGQATTVCHVCGNRLRDDNDGIHPGCDRNL